MFGRIIDKFADYFKEFYFNTFIFIPFIEFEDFDQLIILEILVFVCVD